MKHKFVINDEKVVNAYGFRVMTEGIDTTQFMRNPVVLYIHSRGFEKINGPDGGEVIGRVVNLEKENGQLIGEVEFDVEDEFAKRIAGKVERGFLRMTSLGADVLATSEDPADILPGQIFETVIKSKLTELSIADIGANDNALKLKLTKRLKLNRLKTKSENQMNIKQIALAINMPDETNEAKILEAVQSLQLAKNNAEKRVKELEKAQKDAQTAEANSLVDKAISLNLIPEGLKASQVKSLTNAEDYEAEKLVLSKLIADKEKTDKKDAKSETVKKVILGKGAKPDADAKLSFDYLQKEDPEKLREIRENDPQKYAELAKGYAQGIRYKK